MDATMQQRTIDEGKMNAFMGRVIGDFGAALSSGLAFIGVKLGLYKAMAGGEPYSPEQLAIKTGTTERYVREWLINQASGGYVEYDSATETYSLSPEQEMALTAENSPFYVGGGFYVLKAMLKAQPQILNAFQNGGGMLWGDHDPDLFVGTEKFFRPGYQMHLVGTWIPSLTAVEEKLKFGATVADIGCGHGASTAIMAKAFPNSKFHGFDNHQPSIERANEIAKEEGVEGKTNFAVSDASSFPDNSYDLICFFDCLHDMGDPLGAMKRAFETLNDDGSCLIVEPMAGNTVEENFNPIGRTFSAASTLCCTANSMALGGPALGAVATEAVLRDVVNKAGFKTFRRATETPFNRVFEARK